MDQLITLLTNLLNLTKVAAVTVPGLLLTGAFALMFWPPPPIDVVPVSHPTFTSMTQTGSSGTQQVTTACDVEIRAIPNKILAPDLLTQLKSWNSVWPQSTLSTKPPDTTTLSIARGLPQGTDPSVRTQLFLDLEQIRIAECQDAETELKQIQKAQSDYLASDLAALDKRKDSAKGSELTEINKQIDEKRTSLLEAQKTMAEQDREQAYLTRYAGLITSRLADPGRIRPKLDFSAFVTLQTNHVVGFIILSIAIGIIAEPFRNTIFGFLARKFFPWT